MWQSVCKIETRNFFSLLSNSVKRWAVIQSALLIVVRPAAVKIEREILKLLFLKGRIDDARTSVRWVEEERSC
jgi:hypothetical protein